ncbi:MAG: phenylalanine--tRNA ligase subunit alpha [Chloroflexi bacterium RBG_13_54_8]|nr:MAG: phenylalanine--tRNA ligase subunit alpha [Chloroflexi bacterium RBG_13_54_8]
MLEELEKLKARAAAELDSLHNLRQLEEWRVRFLGRKGSLTSMLRELSALPLEERRAAGAAANEIKDALELLFEQRESSLKGEELAAELEKSRIDVTLPGYPIPLGRLHPTTQIIREICNIFVSLGFQVVEGPEVEWDYYNFEALNIPDDHPARDMWATLWIGAEERRESMLLRTHTSPMQIRLMEKVRPPVRAVVPGKVYRYEATDATHESMFHQIEGLAVDVGITLGDLKGTLFEFARRLFGEDRKARFRCDYFPFVEPGVEMAIDCLICHGSGCRLCGNSGWIEILGAGMVHPEVLRRVNYDPEVYTGFAFGLGVERIPMLRYGIEDIRLFYSNDLRFLRQF